jgi:hypothetical protein
VELRTKRTDLKQHKKTQIINNIQNTERKMRCLKTCKSINNPKSEPGGLTHILIEKDSQIRRIDDRKEMEDALHGQNDTHFAQAKNTPCASGTVASLLTENGISQTTKDILANKKVSNIPKDIEEMFEQLKIKREPLLDYLPIPAMIDGFHK